MLSPAVGGRGRLKVVLGSLGVPRTPFVPMQNRFPGGLAESQGDRPANTDSLIPKPLQRI